MCGSIHQLIIWLIDSALRMGSAGSADTGCIIVLLEGGAEEDAVILFPRDCRNIAAIYNKSITDVTVAGCRILVLCRYCN